MREIEIKSKTIRLEQLLKLAGVVITGGEAKTLIQDGMVKVNGTVEKRRGKNLIPGDIVTMPGGVKLKVFSQED